MKWLLKLNVVRKSAPTKEIIIDNDFDDVFAGTARSRGSMLHGQCADGYFYTRPVLNKVPKGHQGLLFDLIYTIFSLV